MNTPVNVDFYDIYGYYTQPIWQTTWFKITSAIIITLALGIIIAYIIIRHKRRIISPTDWALQELKKYQPALCKNKQDFKKFYFNLTSIIKKYLNKRFGWQTHDKTDEELLVYLMQQRFDNNLLALMHSITEGAVLVKFADQDVIKTQAEKDYQATITIIEQTKPLDTKS